MVVVRQSDLASWARCPQQVFLRRKGQAEGRREETLSATVYGTIMHLALQTMEQLHAEGADNVCERSVATFEHFWHPDHIREADENAGEITWLPRQTYGGLLIRGRETLRMYYETLRHDDGQVLGLELPFTLPITLDMPGGPEEHTIHGTVDRLALRSKTRRLFLSVEDFKTGVKPKFLRYAMQWTIYSYASLQPGFWEPFGDHLEAITKPLYDRGYALFEDGSGLPVIPRRGRWLAVRDGFEINDCGWRTAADYARMKVAMAQYVASVQAGIYPLTVSGDTCMYCPYARDGSCGGIPIAEITEGEPDFAVDKRIRL